MAEPDSPSSPDFGDETICGAIAALVGGEMTAPGLGTSRRRKMRWLDTSVTWMELSSLMSHITLAMEDCPSPRFWSPVRSAPIQFGASRVRVMPGLPASRDGMKTSNQATDTPRRPTAGHSTGYQTTPPTET